MNTRRRLPRRTAPARFCSIAATHVDGVPQLFALDRSGRVWQWSRDLKRWYPLPRTRGPATL